MQDLIKVLEASINNHGEDKVLTLGHLKNIVVLAGKVKKVRIERKEKAISDLDSDESIFGVGGQG